MLINANLRKAIEPREVQFEALEKAREEAFKNLLYKKKTENLTINTTVSRIEGDRHKASASKDQTSYPSWSTYSPNYIGREDFEPAHFERTHDTKKTSHPTIEGNKIQHQVQVVLTENADETKVIFFKKTVPKKETDKKDQAPKQERCKNGEEAPKHEYTFAEFDALHTEMKQVGVEAARKCLHNRRAIAKIYGPEGTYTRDYEWKKLEKNFP